MSPKASSDFGLYKEKQKENHLKSIKFVSVIVITVLFLSVTLYALVLLMNKNNSMEIGKPAARAEKLVSQTVKREIMQPPPKPFGLTHRGQPPSEFTSTTEKITTLSYPQLGSFRHRYYPNNIQDVIGYATRLSRPVIQVKYAANQQSNQNKRSTKNFTDHDPFYLYKPQDPGDINLLATASFRFAPPAWINRKNTVPRVYSHQYQENIKRQEVASKPLSLTLNIYPNKENEVRSRYGLKHFLSQKIENLRSRVRFAESPEKMVIRLNLYPDEVAGSENKVFTRVQSTTPGTT